MQEALHVQLHTVHSAEGEALGMTSQFILLPFQLRRIGHIHQVGGFVVGVTNSSPHTLASHYFS